MQLKFSTENLKEKEYVGVCIHIYIVFVRLFCEEKSLFSSQHYYLPPFVCIRGC